MPDRQLIEQIANALGTRPDLIEKDWHVVRAIGALAAFDHGDARPVFSGGTSLSLAWGLIKRFSEDIDFKVEMPPAASNAAARTLRRAYRTKVLSALTAAQFELISEPHVGNEGRYFAADFAYPSEFGAGPGLRAHLRMEMTFEAPALASITRPIQSLVSRVQKHAPDIPAFSCVDPVETAADKLSALSWRVCVRERGSARDDPRIIRHLHDLAALEGLVLDAPGFPDMLRNSVTADAGRGGSRVPKEAEERFAVMFDRLQNDRLWVDEYDAFVRNVSFAAPAEIISFHDALAATQRLVSKCR